MKHPLNRCYLDVCALGRPFDDQRFHRIAMETLAVIMITACIKQKKLHLFYSPVHEVELTANTDILERSEILKLLHEYGRNCASMGLSYNAIEKRALHLVSLGFGIADAFHVANAESIGAAFVTCEDSLIGKCLRYTVSCWSGSPIDYCKKAGLL